MTGSTADLAKLVAAAEKACSEATVSNSPEGARAVDALKLLKETPVTVAVLTDTQAGRRIKKLTKHASITIANAAKAVVEEWRKAVDQEKARAGKEGNRDLHTQRSTASMASLAQSEAPEGGLTPQPSIVSAGEQAPPEQTGDAKRDKARVAIADALKAALCDVPHGSTGEVAGEVETAVLEQSGGNVTPAYLSKIRSLKFNLAKPDNPDLRRDVLAGRIGAQRLVNMTAEEMAPEKLKEECKAIRDKMMFEVQRGGQQKATTDQFQSVWDDLLSVSVVKHLLYRCGKCKKRETTFYQLQTRSADEPMTTFVTCVNCGNRWKFC